MVKLVIVVFAFVHKKKFNRIARLPTFLIVMVWALLFSGCASIGYFDRNDDPKDEGVISGRETYPWAVMNITRSELCGIGYLGWKGGPFALLSWSPYFAIDLPISLCVDTVTMPWQIYRYSNFPDQKKSEAESPQIDNGKML